MKTFQYSGMPVVYFGEGALKTALEKELPAAGSNVLLAYGGGSIKKNGIYDEVMELLGRFGKKVTEFSGIMANPTYAKVQEGAVPSSTAARSFPRRQRWTRISGRRNSPITYIRRNLCRSAP